MEMNIFTIIRYPLSVEFRIEDLKHIPTPVLEEWWQWGQKNLYGHTNRKRIPCSIDRIHQYLNHSTKKSVRDQLLAKLKELLIKWDNREDTLYNTIHTK